MISEPNPYSALEAALDTGGPEAVLEQLTTSLREAKKYPELYEALLMKKRRELGLPLRGTESIRDLPENVQSQMEDHSVAMCRLVGELFLKDGDIQGAWPYFRAIDELEGVRAALESWRPPEEEDDDGAEGEGNGEVGAESAPYDPETYDNSAVDLLDGIIDIAFNQGAHPLRGYELIISEYGTCRAITIFEHQFPYSGEIKESCGKLLVRHLYDELLANLRGDAEQREIELPADASVGSIVKDHPEFFGEHGYHIDVSHLQSVIRGAAGLESPEELDLALQMSEYGRQLARDFQSNDPPPFDDFYNDYRILLRALAGEGHDGAVRYFMSKADRASIDETGRHFPGEVVVYLQSRLGRHDDAIESAQKYLGDVRGQTGLAPEIGELCRQAGQFETLKEISRENDDLLQFAAAAIDEKSPPPAP